MKPQSLFLIPFCLLLFFASACNKEESLPIPETPNQTILIELELFGMAHRSVFTNNEWQDWGDGLKVTWKAGGRIMNFEFPDNWNLSYEGILQTLDKTCFSKSIHPKESPFPFTGMTFELPACMMGKQRLLLTVGQ